MRIAILTSGRFHVCDLARELAAQGHDVAFYSLVPPWRTRRFGLPSACNRWLGPRVGSLYLLTRLSLQTRHAARLLFLMSVVIDRVAARMLEPCDLFIGMSQMSLRSIKRARASFGAQTFLERGSRHILAQREILARLPRQPTAPPPILDAAIRRELEEYDVADVIVVPARHAEQSFVERGVSPAKMFRNPYGVDLSMFPPTPAPPAPAPPTIIMAGNWSLQKGCDVLTDAWRRLPQGTRLLHVGAVGDAPLPRHAGFQHHSAVDQRRLTEHYAQAHVMALASRQEGLGLVLAQGLASGLHVAATGPTGAEDLRELLDEPAAIAIAPTDDPQALAETLTQQLGHARSLVGSRDLLHSARDRFTWAAYGRRYGNRIAQLAGASTAALPAQSAVGAPTMLRRVVSG